MSGLTDFTQRAAELVWGTPLVSLLLGGGVFFFDPLSGDTLSEVRARLSSVNGPLRHP